MKYVKHLCKNNTQGRYSALFNNSEGLSFCVDFLVAVSVYWDGSILITRNTRECSLKLYSRLPSRTVSAWLNPFKSFPTHLHLQTESSKDLSHLLCMTQCLQQALTTDDLKKTTYPAPLQTLGMIRSKPNLKRRGIFITSAVMNKAVIKALWH